MAETNKLLQSIGAGVNLNMTDVVEKQVRDMLTRFKNEIQKAAAQTTQFGTQAAKGLGNAGTQIQTLLNTTQKLNSDGSITETRKGYDKLGQSMPTLRSGLRHADHRLSQADFPLRPRPTDRGEQAPLFSRIGGTS